MPLFPLSGQGFFPPKNHGALSNCTPPTAAARRGAFSRGTGERHHLLGLGHLKDVPERSGGTDRGPRRNSARTPKRGGRRVRRDGRTPPSPAAGEGRARKTHKPRKASGECPLRQRRPRARKAPRSGRVPHPSPSTHRLRAEGRGEGPAGRARRAAPFAKECPSLVWRGLGPARESATSPHRSDRAGQAEKQEREKRGAEPANGAAAPAPIVRGGGGKRGEDNRLTHRTGLRASKASPRKPSLSLSFPPASSFLGRGSGRRSTARGDRGPRPEAHNSRRRAGPPGVRLSLAQSRGTGRGRRASGSRPEKLPGRHPTSPSSSHPRTACPH